ncbi:MAG: hypothetical protein M0C28_32125 [Candidatus Moduliflexus flocculans]|nr:hypothetical protein [Candidatus Moduliflexus flocculans]
MKSNGLPNMFLHKVHEKKRPNIRDFIAERKIDFVISIPDPERKAAFDSDYEMRRMAVDFPSPCSPTFRFPNYSSSRWRLKKTTIS